MASVMGSQNLHTNSGTSKAAKPPNAGATSASMMGSPVPEVPTKSLKRADKFIRNSAKDLGAVLTMANAQSESANPLHSKLDEPAKTDRTIVVSQLGKNDSEKRAESVKSRPNLEREKDKMVSEVPEKDPTSKSETSKFHPGDVSHQTLGNSTENSLNQQHNNSKTSPSNARKERSLSEKTRKFDRTASNDVTSPVVTSSGLNTGGRNSSVKGNSNVPLPTGSESGQWSSSSHSSYQRKQKKYNNESGVGSGGLGSLGPASQSFYGTVGHIISGKKSGQSGNAAHGNSPNVNMSASGQPGPSSLTSRTTGVKSSAQTERTPDSSFVASNAKPAGHGGGGGVKTGGEGKSAGTKAPSIYERGEVLANCSIYMRVVKGIAKEESAAVQSKSVANTQSSPAPSQSLHPPVAPNSSVLQSTLNSSGATALVNSNHLKAKKRR